MSKLADRYVTGIGWSLTKFGLVWRVAVASDAMRCDTDDDIGAERGGLTEKPCCAPYANKVILYWLYPFFHCASKMVKKTQKATAQKLCAVS